MARKRAKFPSRLLIYGVSAESWSKRWGLEPFTNPCVVCGKSCSTTIPFVQGAFRGLQAPPCYCGHPFPPYCVVVDFSKGDLLNGHYCL
jgi:hypothetical protein